MSTKFGTLKGGEAQNNSAQIKLLSDMTVESSKAGYFARFPADYHLKNLRDLLEDIQEELVTGKQKSVAFPKLSSYYVKEISDYVAKIRVSSEERLREVVDANKKFALSDNKGGTARYSYMEKVESALDTNHLNGVPVLSVVEKGLMVYVKQASEIAEADRRQNQQTRSNDIFGQMLSDIFSFSPSRVRLEEPQGTIIAIERVRTVGNRLTELVDDALKESDKKGTLSKIVRKKSEKEQALRELKTALVEVRGITAEGFVE